MIGFVSTRPQKTIRLTHVLLLFIALFLLTSRFSGSSYGSRTLWITEIMASNRGTIADEDGEFPDWIELHNAGNSAIELEGFWLSNDPANPLKWAFPPMALAPQGYLLVFASGKDRSDSEGPHLHTNFKLSATGTTVVLSTPDVRIVDSIETDALMTNVSLGRVSLRRNEWTYFIDSTPGSANNGPGLTSISIGPATEQFLYVSEFMTMNNTSLMDSHSDRPDWIEIHNSGNTPRSLHGYWLSDEEVNPLKWRFPDITIAPGEYLVVFASDKDSTGAHAGFLHANFKLNTQDFVVFSTPDGQTIDSIKLNNMIADVSYGRDENNRDVWLYYPAPTPGSANFTKGFITLSGKTLPRSSSLHINEVMAQNYADLDDWIEIYNSGTMAINLEGYGLSDDVDDPYQWVFPNITIEPMDHLLVFASGADRSAAGLTPHTNFRISAAGEIVVLTAPTGEKVDEFVTCALSTGLSAGRSPDGANNRVLFERPSPGSINNTNGLAGYAMPPQVSQRSGFYKTSLSITLHTDFAQHPTQVIRFTLDGQEPTDESPIFTQPIVIERTSVLRARVFVEGLLPSSIISETYFVNETTTLSAVSIMIDPKDMWDPVYGLYVQGPNADDDFPYVGANFWQEIEKPIHFQVFEPDGRLGLRFDAGIRIGGQFSRAMPQKAFNVFARNEYGSDVFEYPFFPDKSLTTFKAITLRTSGQDSVLSRIRDTMMTSLLSETDLDYQAYRPAALFINGAYWGLYNIRERINEYFIAYNHDVAPDKVDLLQGNGTVRAGSNSHYRALERYVSRQDMSETNNYEYVQTQMDVKNFMDYWIAQIYFANTDSANIRFWREQSEEGRWRWIVYDLDWGFFSLNDNTLSSVTYPEGTGIGNNLSTTLLVNLLKNEEFKQLFLERFAYHLKYTFATERVIGLIDEMAATIEGEIPRHLQRWGGTLSAWKRDVEFLRYFAERRPAIVLGHIQREFGLSTEQMKMFY